MGRLDDTLLIVTADHGHSIGDEGYLGKRSYPSEPAVFEIPLIVRHPEGLGAGRTNDGLVQHTDIPATVLAHAGVEPSEHLDGHSLLEATGQHRDHVTIGWGGAVTVIDRRWWLNIKVDGSGAFLFDLDSPAPRTENVADRERETAERLYRQTVADARGEFPEYLLDLARIERDAPGCSDLAALPA